MLRQGPKPQHLEQLCGIKSPSVLSMGEESEWITFLLKEQGQSRQSEEGQKIRV